MEQLLATATIGASFGLTGEVRLYPNNPEWGYLKKLKNVVLQSPGGKKRQVEIVSLRKVGGQLVAKFVGIDSPEEARLLARSLVLVERGNAYQLKKGEVYAADLVGLSVLFQGRELGKVGSLIDGPQAVLLEVVCNDGGKHLVPYLEPYIERTDIVKREIHLKVDWILQ